MQFQCSCCGKTHDSWPALTFKAPDPYAGLSEEERREMATFSSDFCVIKWEDQTDRFIRVTFTQKVLESCQDLDYGVWVSLSETSFADYEANFHNDSHEATYFGWLCNEIWGYDFSKGGIPMTVRTRPNGQRPEAFPHEGFDHPFVRDFYDGITLNEAERRIGKLGN